MKGFRKGAEVKRTAQNKAVYIIAGPNGSGKTTFAKELMNELSLPFVNADEIAMEISPIHLEKVRIQAGRIFFAKIEEHILSGKSFIVETTLAGKYFVRLIEKLRQNDYTTDLIYIFVESDKEAIRRIDIRVKKGGHPVPEEDIIRRFWRSKRNFWNIYRKMVNGWKLFLNNKDDFLQVAAGAGNEVEIVNEENLSLFREGI